MIADGQPPNPESDPDSEQTTEGWQSAGDTANALDASLQEASKLSSTSTAAPPGVPGLASKGIDQGSAKRC